MIIMLNEKLMLSDLSEIVNISRTENRKIFSKEIAMVRTLSAKVVKICLRSSSFLDNIIQTSLL
jgi:hypothetical protein